MAVVNRQMLLASFVCELKLLRTLWRERSSLRSIVDSGNYRFLQFALPGHFKEPVQELPDELFASLHENDILFVDSSHVAKAHSDVVHVFFRILPLLNKGVI